MRHHKPDIDCSRPSIFSNPYVIGKDGTRDEVCDKFIPYFKQKLTDPLFRAKVLVLKGKRLGCWCRCLPSCNNPKCKSHRCHLETIVKHLEENENKSNNQKS
jgi:hypothetical protein